MGGKKFIKKNGGNGSGKTNTRTNTPEKKIAVMEFTPHTAGRHQLVTYDTVKEYILQEMQKDLRHGYDIVKCLREGINVGIPILKPIRIIEELGEQSAEEQKIQQEGHDMEWQIERKEYSVRKNVYEENIFKAYAIIFGYCNKAMQTRIEETTEFELKIRNDPWLLMETIKLRMYGQVRAKYEFVQPTDTLLQFLTLKQEHGESLGDYNKRFNQGQDNLKGIFGTKFLNEYITKTEKYKAESDQDKRTELQQKSYKTWCSYVYLKNSDQNKYGTLKKSLQSQYALGNDQYPITISKMTDVLTNHSWDNAYAIATKKRKESSGSKTNTPTTPIIDTQTEGVVLTQNEKEDKKKNATCFCCGEKGHYSPQCPKRDETEHKDWKIKSDNKKGVTWGTGVSGLQTGMIGLQIHNDRNLICLHQSKIRATDFENDLVLDTGATFSSMKNKNLLAGVYEADKPIKMCTNTGTRLITQRGEMLGMKTDPWLDKESMANIVSFGELKRQYRVTYDSDHADSFFCHTENGIIKFDRTKEGLYTLRLSDEYKTAVEEKDNIPELEEKESLINTVGKNMSHHSAAETKRAKIARKLYHVIGGPTPKRFKDILRSNQIKNCPVVENDVDLAHAIYGEDVATLKSKTVRRTPRSIIQDFVKVPPDLVRKFSKIDLCIDVMYVNRIGFMTSIGYPLIFRKTVYTEDGKTETLYKCLDQILRIYNNGGFKINVINCDNGFRSMLDAVSDQLDCRMNYTNAQDHEPRIERNNRTIKNQVRLGLHRAAYKAIPRTMIKELVEGSTEKFNFFVAKNGVSDHFSPETIVTGRTLDYKKQCQYEFGEYVQADTYTEPRNDMRERTLDAIYCRPNENDQGGHILMDLLTGSKITRQRIHPCPLTLMVKNQVEALAKAQGIINMKFTNKKGQTLDHADWIAGVDYDVLGIENEPEPTDDENDQDEVEDNEEPVIQVANPTRGELVEDEEEEEAEEDPADTAMQATLDEMIDELNDAIIPEGEEILREVENQVETVDEVETEPDDLTEDPVERLIRPHRERNEPDRLTYSNFSTANTVQTNQIPRMKPTYGEIVKRNLKRSQDYIECKHNLFQQATNKDDHLEYRNDEAIVAGHFINEMAMKYNFGQQYTLAKGLKKFGEKGIKGTEKEIGQLHDRACFKPVRVEDMSNQERRKAQIALAYLTEKKSGEVKGRIVYNGAPTRKYMEDVDTSSPTASLEGILLTAIIDAHEERDVMSSDIPNAFIQAPMPKKKDEETVFMKIIGPLVGILVGMHPELYKEFVVYENNKPVLYVEILRALYGMLESALLWYNKFRKDLEEEGFIFNAYDPCVANKMVNEKQMTIKFHVDDLMSSHVDPTVNDKFLEFLNKKYGQHVEVKATRGNQHDYLGMKFTFKEKKLEVDMIDYIDSMIEEFPIKFDGEKIVPNPAAADMFEAESGKLLPTEKKELYHRFTAKALFLCKRARPDIQPIVSVLCTRVKQPTEKAFSKLIRMMKFLSSTRKDTLKLSAGDGINKLEWFVDASFAVHPDFRSHTGATFRFGGGLGSPIQMSVKQKLNTDSSTTSELVAVHQCLPKILWAKLFIEAQGYLINENIVYQDNQSAILLERNGKKSSSKRTRHLNIRYFMVTDQVEKGNISIKYCPTDEMIGDFMTKGLQGVKFAKFRKAIMGH
jgi:hypothetical protein